MLQMLDVGCGYRPKGDVNIDKLKRPYEAEGPQHLRCALNIQAIGEFLPFKDGTFNSVISNHVIEHSYNPKHFVEECLRVSNSKVLIRCPHRKSSVAKLIHHKWYFDEKWFTKQWICTSSIDKEPFLPVWVLKSNNHLRWFLRRLCKIIHLQRAYSLSVTIFKMPAVEEFPTLVHMPMPVPIANNR